jgi:hypothetical protein
MAKPSVYSNAARRAAGAFGGEAREMPTANIWRVTIARLENRSIGTLSAVAASRDGAKSSKLSSAEGG